MKEVKLHYLGALFVILAPHQGSIILQKKEGKILDSVQYTLLLCSAHSFALPSPYFITNIVKVMAFENSSDAKWTNLKDTY